MKTLYTTAVTSTGGRNGKIVSDDGVLNLDIRMPKSMGGEGGSYSNPEQLFAAGYAACFESALLLAAQQEKKKVRDTAVRAEVRLLADDSSGFQLDISLYVRVGGTDPESARDLMEKAHHICPYSKAIAGNVNVRLHLNEQAEKESK